MEPFKNVFNEKFIDEIGNDIKKVYDDFDHDLFKSLVFEDIFETLELKERMRHITFALGKVLRGTYEENINILIGATRGRSGMPYMVLPDYVEVFGLMNLEVSKRALKEFTSLCSSEFAVRPFIIRYEDEMIKEIKKWTEDENEHVRRLASEGTRPILPWAMDIPAFRSNPEKILGILEKLKDDESAYVRKSVANNLNSISKDHPEVTLEIAKKWYGKDKNRNQLVKHGLRTILKSSDERALKLLGYHNPKDIKIKNLKGDKKAKMGGYYNFSFELCSENELGKLRLEYIMDFVRLNNKRSQKVFKISESDFKGNIKKVEKKHSFKPVTTRKYYKGLHKITLLVNGCNFGTLEFDLE